MRTPDIESSLVRGWNLTHRLNELAADENQPQIGLAGWLLLVSWATPFWNWYILCVVSLRDVPGFPPAKKQYPEATSELLIAALAPDSLPPDLDPANVRRFTHLNPIDQAVQFHGLTDGQAVRVAEEMVRRIAGGLSPDRDFRGLWLHQLGRVVQTMRKEV